MEKTRDFSLTQMRESVAKLGSSAERFGDPTLMRFLITRSMDPEKAAKMFVKWQSWRADFVPLGFIPEAEIQDELEAGKIYLQGLSQLGCPVLIIESSKHSPARDQLQFKKFVVYLLDKAIASAFKGREIGNEKLIGVIDLQHLSYKNVDVRAFITGFQLFQDYYPERLAKLYLLHMPRFFVGVWRVVSRFLEKATLEKVVIVSSEKEKKEFVNEIGEEVLPKDYGGSSKLVALQDFVLAPRQDCVN